MVFIMNIQSVLKRILAMIGIGIVLVLIFYAIGVPYHAIGTLTGGILFFVLKVYLSLQNQHISLKNKQSAFNIQHYTINTL